MLFKLLLLLAVGARTISSESEGFGSIKEVFEVFQSRRSTHCDVSKHEARTGYKPSCDTPPVNGLVPDGTVCAFWTGYFTRTTQVCEQGFWYQERSHAHRGQRVKRWFSTLDELFERFNLISDNDVAKPIVSQTEDPEEEETEAWIHCPGDPYEIMSDPGVIDFLLEYDIPEYDEEGWVVSMSAESSVWVSPSGTVNILQVAGSTQFLSFVANNAASGRLKFCTIYFHFLAPQCDVTEILDLDPNSCVDCYSDYTGIHGEKCYMSCKLGWKLTAENYATCEVQEDGSTMWKWKAEANDLEAAPPFCTPSECTPNDPLDTETTELECYDPVTDDIVETTPSGPVMAGSFCKRQCADNGGLVCGDGYTEVHETNNEYYCSYEETWSLEYEKCGKGSIWLQCMGAVHETVEHGKLCCSQDKCDLRCDTGFTPSDDPVLVCKKDPDDDSYKWFRWDDETPMSDEDFPECHAQCGSLPPELLNDELKKDGPSDCSETNVEGTCRLSCPEYYDLKGTDTVSCIFNPATNIPEWDVPTVDGEPFPWCEEIPCDDLHAPDHGTVMCEEDEDGVKTCTVECNEGYTHSLKYNTSFTCDQRRTGMWTDAKNIPVCYESDNPMVGLNLTVEVTANENDCYQLVTTLDLESLKTESFSHCPTGCTCEAEELFSDYLSEDLCLLWLPVTFDCNVDTRFRDIVSRVASMVYLIVWQDEDTSVTEPPSVTYFEEGICPSGYSPHQATEANPVTCVQCMTGFEYDPDTKDCEPCESGHSFLGKCTEWEAEEPAQVFCNFGEIRDGLRFSNCSTLDMAAETVCKVHCSNPDQEISVMGAVFAHCTDKGFFEYSPDEFTCEDVECDPGFYSETGMKPCRPCEKGYYTNTAAVGATECLPCPEGYTTGYDSQMDAVSCEPIGSVVCSLGDYYDDDFGQCVACPYGTYCPDGQSVRICTDKSFTRTNRSVSEADCVQDSWTVEAGDAMERTMTITGLYGLTDFDSMSFYMRKPHDDVCVTFEVRPYELEICGNGRFWFRDLVSEPYKGWNLFSPDNIFGDNWVYISNTAYAEGFLFEYGHKREWIESPEDIRPPLEDELAEMTITVTLVEGTTVTLTPDRLPYFVFMQLYIHDYDENYLDDGSEGVMRRKRGMSSGDSSSSFSSSGFPDSMSSGFLPGSYPGSMSSGFPSGSYPSSMSSGFLPGSYPGSMSSGFPSGSYPSSMSSGFLPGSYPGSMSSGFPSGSYPSSMSSGFSGSYPSSMSSGFFSGSYPGYMSSGSYAGSGYPGFGHSGFGSGYSGSGSGDIPSDYEQHKKRNCYKNLMNKNGEGDWPETQPVSCPRSECPSGHRYSGPFNCEPCPFGTYYSADTNNCESCPYWGVTRGTGKSDPNDCAYDYWIIYAYDQVEGFSGPSAKIMNLVLPNFGAISFNLHRPGADVTVYITFSQYELRIKEDGSFKMMNDGIMLIDGDEADIFAAASATGWSKCVIWMDEEFMELVFEYNDEEKRSSNMIDLGFSEADIEIPTGVELPFTIDVQRNDLGITVKDSGVLFAYMQVFANSWEIEQCPSNLLFGQTVDYVEACEGCVSTNRPYSCPETAEFLSCSDPKEVFDGTQMTFDCTLAWGFISSCTLGCEPGFYLHGADSILCLRSWLFSWNKGVPSCQATPPDPFSCQEPKLPDNMYKVSVDNMRFTVACDAGYNLQGGFDEATEFVCDSATLEWDPAFPKCYESMEPQTGIPFKLQLYNPLKLSCEQIRNRLIAIIKSNAVKKNSPSGWDATFDIFHIGCDSGGAVRRKRASDDTTAQGENAPDEKIQYIVHEVCAPDEELECLQEKWSEVREYLEEEIEGNIQKIYTLLGGIPSSADLQSDLDRVDELSEASYALLYDEGLWYLYFWVKEEMEGHDENYIVQWAFEELMNEMDTVINGIAENLANTALNLEQQYSQFGLGGGGRLVEIDAKIMANIPVADLDLLSQAVDMLEQYKSSLMIQSVAVSDTYYGTTGVECADGRDLAAKGQCEKKTCDEDNVLNEINECVRCDKWTSIIDEDGVCSPCPQNSRVKDKMDGTKICAEQCPAGSFSTDGFKNADTGNCTKCPPGDYQDSLGQQECKPCEGLSTSTKPGSTDCTTAYDIELNNMGEDPVRVRNLFSADIQKMSLAIMVRRRGQALNIQIDIGEYRTSIDDSSVSLSHIDDEETAVFEFDDDHVNFDEFTPILIAVGDGTRKVYIYGKLLDEIPYEGEFEIPEGSVLETSGNCDITNFYLSDRIEIDPKQFFTREGVSDSRNLFGKEEVEADEIDETTVKMKTTTFTGEVTNYCANNPCQNGGSCSRGMGTFECACQHGYSGKKCEKQHEEKVSLWSEWHKGPCSVTCGGGTQINTRRCSECSGVGCQGDDTETVPCNTEPCKVCTELTYSETKVTAAVTETSSKTTYTFTCPAGKVFAKQENKLPVTSLHCGAETKYKWIPSDIPPECTGGSKPPTELKKRVGANFSPGQVAQIDCTEPALSKFKSEFILSAKLSLTCLTSTTGHVCVAVVVVSKCDGAARKKRNTQQDVFLEFTLPLDEAVTDLQALYDTNTVSPELLDVVQAIADLENVETEVKSLNVSINGDTYTVDPATVTASTSGTCDPGYYSDSTSCVPCAAGTYHDSSSGFCVLCPKAEYQDEEAQTSCKECDTGYTTAVTGSTMASHCIVDSTYVGPRDVDDDDSGNNGKVVGIAVGASIAGVVLIGAGVALAFRLYMTSKAKGSASLPTQNLVHPNVPSKDKLYNEIDNPHFVPPPKPYDPAFNNVLNAEFRTATPPGTVVPVTE